MPSFETMTYVTEQTIWPEFSLPQSVRDLIVKLYEIADTKGHDAGHRLATEVFTENGSMISGAKTATGTNAITRSRDNAWDAVSERRHYVLRVYSREDTGRDLMLTGKVAMTLRNGKVLESEFATQLNVDIESYERGKPRFSKVQVFVDTAPLTDALRGQ